MNNDGDDWLCLILIAGNDWHRDVVLPPSESVTPLVFCFFWNESWCLDLSSECVSCLGAQREF